MRVGRGLALGVLHARDREEAPKDAPLLDWKRALDVAETRRRGCVPRAAARRSSLPCCAASTTSPIPPPTTPDPGHRTVGGPALRRRRATTSERGASWWWVQDRKLVHRIQISSRRDWIGIEQSRDGELDGDVLTVRAFREVDARPQRRILVWRRAERSGGAR